MDVLFKADDANELNEIVKSEINPNLFIFCNYEPTPKITEDLVGLFLLKICNFYKLLKDSGWIINKLAYIYSGNDKIGYSVLPFAMRDIGTIYFAVTDLRTVFCHNISQYNGDSIIINNINKQFNRYKLYSSIDYASFIKSIDNDANTVIVVCKDFINCVKKMPDADRESAVDRWKEVIIEHYKNKTDIMFNMIGSYYLSKNALSYIPKNFRENVEKEIILSYFTYDFEQHRKKIKSLLVKYPKKSMAAIKTIDNNWDNRALDLFGIADHNLFYDAQKKEQLINLFFEKELENAINEVIKSKPDCSLLPQAILNEVFSATTVFNDLKTPYERFDFSLR